MTENTQSSESTEQNSSAMPALYEFPFFGFGVRRAWLDCVDFYKGLGVDMANAPKTAGQLRRVKTIVFDECNGLTADVPLLKAGNWTPSELRVACHMALGWQSSGNSSGQSPLCAGLLSVMDNVGWQIEPWQAQTIINANTTDGDSNSGIGVSCSRPDGVYMLGNRDFVVRDGKQDDMPTLWLFVPSGKRIAFRFEYKVENAVKHGVERLQNSITGGGRTVVLMSGHSPEMVQAIADRVGIENSYGLQNQSDKQALIADLVKRGQNPLVLNYYKNSADGGFKGWHGVICPKNAPPTSIFKTHEKTVDTVSDHLSTVLDIMDTAHLYRAFQYRVWTLGICLFMVLLMLAFTLLFI